MIDIAAEINATRRAVAAGRAEGREFITRSSLAWGAANQAAGATAAEAEAAVRHTTRFYTGEAQPAG